jgi:hypothetical protein
MTPFSHRFSALSLSWIFVMCAATACSSPDSPLTTTGPGGTSALACAGEPLPVSDSFLTETLSTGFVILSSNSERNIAGADGLRCCQVKESLSTQECRKP